MYRCWFLHTTDGPIKFSFIKFKVLRYVTCLAPRGKWDYKAWHEDIIAPTDGTKPWRDTIARRLGSNKVAATCGVSLHSCFGIPVTSHLWWWLVEASILFRGCICHCSESPSESSALLQQIPVGSGNSFTPKWIPLLREQWLKQGAD